MSLNNILHEKNTFSWRIFLKIQHFVQYLHVQLFPKKISIKNICLDLDISLPFKEGSITTIFALAFATLHDVSLLHLRILMILFQLKYRYIYIPQSIIRSHNIQQHITTFEKKRTYLKKN